MTYIVSGGTLNPTHSLSHSRVTCTVQCRAVSCRTLRTKNYGLGLEDPWLWPWSLVSGNECFLCNEFMVFA